MKVYIAGNPNDSYRLIKNFMADLVRAGYDVFDWVTDFHNEKEKVCRPQVAIDEVQAVRDSDALVLFDSRVGYGMYVELGVALGLKKKVIVVAPYYQQIFYSHPGVVCVRDAASAFKLLEQWK